VDAVGNTSTHIAMQDKTRKPGQRHEMSQFESSVHTITSIRLDRSILRFTKSL
jgi:hypothetical protein